MDSVLQYCFWLRACGRNIADGEGEGIMGMVCGMNIVGMEGEWHMVGTLWMGRGKVGGLGGRWPKETAW
jgi:hypothetical protein